MSDADFGVGKSREPARATDLSYHEAAHAMQSGISHLMQTDAALGHPKHLRVGLNSCLVNDAALVRLLVKKGLITHEEYAEEIRLEMCREVDRLAHRIDPTGHVTLR